MALPRTALPAGYRWRTLTSADRRLATELDAWAFPSAHSPDDLDSTPSPLTWERTVGVEADGADDLVAFHASYPFARFPVPGAELPTAGLTWVGVHPQHRRRGLLSAMIDLHLARCVERGEPLSALFAAEAAIYGRFGYGHAANDLRLDVPRGAALRDVPGAEQHTVRVEVASRERHGEIVDRLHRAAGAAPAGVPGLNRPGWVTRETEELQAVLWHDAPLHRGGREARRIMIVELDGEPRGYVTFRRSLAWEPTGPRGQVSTGEVVALDAAAARALWGALLDLDLTNEVSPFVLPVDDVITQLLVNLRAAAPRTPDNLWVRLVDVAAALAGRRYAADVDVTLAVTDSRLPANAGVYHLRAEAFGPATVDRLDGSDRLDGQTTADLSLDVRELGAAYLGGTSLATLAAAGLVTVHRPEALPRASAAFGWPVAPGASWVF
ncbi:enhanced intracellular survival protein Eis [Promicromonospora thailandica]|uniref:Acetyltransferase n=1 Tax=Promicromonospora thailandica TaxID=765201 RepID=A0A9X2FYC8_9MICO|nr:GNAT family N-acetyltransferase [Promicromonospora thailandica]MCP2262835.1 putative acetyltransferase [Promicromonospora thailandica]BFF18169.1 amikacin resistance N-acetyltransferase Eis2 [Promicromonospora thailandica]